MSKDETMHGLKSELERCLAMYRNKRHQVTALGDEVRKLKMELDETTAKLTISEKAATTLKVCTFHIQLSATMYATCITIS